MPWINLLASGLVALGTGTPKFVVDVRYTEIANLTYELDAVCGLLPQIDADPYKLLWNERFLKTDTDRAQLAAWKHLRTKYSASMSVASGQFVSIPNAVRVAGLQADDVDDYLGSIGLVMRAADVARMEEVLANFSPAFHRWFEQVAKAKGKPFATRLVKLWSGNPLRSDVESFARFYSPSLSSKTRVVFSLLYHPEGSGQTTGEQLGSVSAIEFRPNENPEDRMDVVIHEFCHFLYGARSEEAAADLRKAFLATGDPSAKVAMNLLNEGMATALGNGVVGRRFAKPADWKATLDRPLSLYANPNIDRAGKALLKLADSMLNSGKTIDDPTFADDYLAAIKGEFGAELGRPSLYMNEGYLYVDQHIGQEALSFLKQSLAMASFSAAISDQLDDPSLQPLRDDESLSAVFVVPPSQVDALISAGVLPRSALSAIAREVAANGSALFGFRRNAQARTYVVVATSMDGVRGRVRDLAGATANFDGIWGNK